MTVDRQQNNIDSFKKSETREKRKNPLPRGSVPVLYSHKLKGSFGFGVGLRPNLRLNFLKIGLKDVLVHAQHQAVAPGAQGCVIIKSGHPLVMASTIHALVIVDRHD